eukprot:5865777-Ditylum_brightwellii.AAC.1
MCANAGPAEYNYDETLSTLRYANRAKNIKNKPVINEDPKDAMLREYQEEISKLRAQLSNITPEAQEIKNKEDNSNDANQNKMNEEVIKQMQEKADKEKADIEAKSRKQMEELLNENEQTSEERKSLQEKLEKE